MIESGDFKMTTTIFCIEKNDGFEKMIDCWKWYGHFAVA